MTKQVTTAKSYPMPFVRLELVVFTVDQDRLQVLLVQREDEPHAGKWALPGGVLRIDLDADLDAAAARVGHERLGQPLPWLRQLTAVGGASRDPRAPWALSVVYRALVPAGQLSPMAGKRVKAVRWLPAESLAADQELAFDHGRLISDALTALHDEIERLELPRGFLPDQFTLADLQRKCEALSGRKLDKSSFRRRLAAMGHVKPVPGAKEQGGAHRPAQLYRLASSP